MAKKVARTRNNSTMTESMYWSKVRSELRRGFRYWKPMMQCKQDAKRKNEGSNKRAKWQYQCNECKDWFLDKETQIDHITPVGSLKCAEDLAGFLERLTPEDGFQLLCKPCHQIKTNEERK